ncbi:High-affinity leucine-specific transport system, periplasmic binding protein LivK [Marinobacterium lacunae]|uniref:High-affinity leucine-specific transport system, periplasmic binding protein LivK n=1 Tax=Marinobacterium lacunae TaxID=1232683 RepID=A0A081G1H6_9GAMM|nr:high-affinity branched-chain amino acid ABC transporter substrate-binding protein [Marinobacterium lacunae]KEA64631.1 High-affinity leucine-specific transport system, periplasmic binding protein LivK [Marinobacterium lacunae]MBR9884708.1 high-affinity branched-chain amino acid ABC transporter substrate-binding protein [Oceanospirillales bacterium]
MANSYTKRFSKTLLAAATALTIVGTAQADTFKIALAGPATGPVAQYGDMQKIGVMAAIDYLNANGGINGMDVEGVIYDDACDPKQAVAVANKIVNDGITHVVGHLCSSSTEPASDIYEEEGVLMITAASTSPTITEKGYGMIFRTIGLDSLQGSMATQYILDTAKPKTIAVIHDKQQYGEGLATVVRDGLVAAGVEPVMFEGVTAGDKDFSALIAKLQKADVDFVYYGGYHPELGLILRQAAEKGLKAQFMGPEGIVNSDLAKIAGDAVEGVLATAPKAFDQNPENAERVKAIEAKGEDPTGPFVFPAYAAVQIMADTVKAIDSTDSVKMAEYIKANSFDTAIGTVKYDDKGDLTESTFLVYQLHADGSKTPAQ